MARGNQIILTLAGDHSDLSRTFARVGGDADRFGRKVDTLSGRITSKAASWGRSIAKWGTIASATFAGVGVAALAWGKSAVDSAIDVQEALSKSNTIFKSQGRAIEQWAENAAENIGLAKGAALEAVGTFGNMLDQLGFTEQAAADMSTTMTELAADFASFHNADITDVIDAQTAAFRGEYDALQRFLPTISAATVEQRAMELSGKDNAAALTAQEKAAAVYKLMLEGAGEAQGDFSRTSDDAANKIRIQQAEMENLRAEIGEKLLPIQIELTDALIEFTDWVSGDLIPALEDWWASVDQDVIPVIEDLKMWVTDELLPGLQDLAEYIKREVIPVWDDLWALWQEDILPVLKDVNEWVQSLSDKVSDASGEVSWVSKAFELWGWWLQNWIRPARIAWQVIGAIVDVASACGRAIAKVGEAIGWVIEQVKRALGWLSDLASKLGSVTSAISGFSPVGTIANVGRRGAGIVRGVTKFLGFAEGGVVTPSGIQFSGRGTDTVPAMLTPGEAVLTKSDQARLFDMIRGRQHVGGATVNVYVHGSVLSERELIGVVTRALDSGRLAL